MAIDPKQRRDRIQQIITDDVFRDACEASEERLVAAWKGATTTEAREAIWHEYQGLVKILKRFHGFMNEGDLAEHDETRKP